MKNLYIKNEDNLNYIALVEDGVLVEKYIEDLNNESIEGNIYIGKIQNVLVGLQSAFVNIGEKKNAFIHVKDILPKIDITKESQDSNIAINKLVKPGDPIIVEVKRETTEYKGPKVSTHISIVGRKIVFLPNATYITVSHKIEEDSERNRLIEIVREILPENTGAIIRTSAEKATTEELKKDLDTSVNKWKKIKSQNVEKIPQKIFVKGGILTKSITDLIDVNLNKIIVNNEFALNKIKDILCEIDAEIKVEVDENCFLKDEIEKQWAESKKRKIWLNCGGFITIDETEALTAIDVNSGKYIGSKDLEKTVLTVNLEAAREIAKQLRLRDISGIIIVDFIDMQNEKDEKKVSDEILKFSKKDRSRVQIEGFTKLNLLELTRKHINSKSN